MNNNDRKIAKTAILFFLLLLFFLGLYNPQIHARPSKILVVGSKTHAPFEFLDANQKPQGIFVNIWRLWSKKTGIKVEYRLMEWTKALEIVKTGKADVVSGLFYSKERDKFLDFSLPYYQISSYIFFHKNIYGLHALNDLAGFKIGVVKEDYAEKYIRKHLPKVHLFLGKSYEDLIQNAIRKEIMVFVTDTPVATFLLAKYGKINEFKHTAKPLYVRKFHAAVKDGNKELLQIINTGLKSISPDDITHIEKSWIGIPLVVHLPWKVFGVVTFLGLFLFGGVSLWNYQLRQRIIKATAELRKKQNQLQQAYNALRISEEKFRRLAESMAIGIFIIQDDKLRYVNPAIERVTGYTKDELLNMKIWEIIAPEFVPIIKKQYAKRKTGEQGLSRYEIKIITKNGRGLWIDYSSIYFNFEGRPAVLGSAIDITKRKQAEEALAQEKERLAVTLLSIGDAVIVTDETGKITLMNKVAEELTGWSQREALGHPVSEVFHIVNEFTEEKCESPFDKVKKTSGICGLANNTILIAKDGTERIIADSGAPIKDREGNLIGVVIVFRNITEQRKVREMSLRMAKLESLTLLAGGIAHDFNNLLMAILGNLSIIKFKVQNGYLTERLDQMEKATLKAKELTQRLLGFTKGGLPVKKRISISDLLQDVTTFILAGSNIKYEFNILPDLWPVEIDEVQMEQVIQNIVINAKQAMPEGGRLLVLAENVELEEKLGPLQPGKYIKISIKDTGIGIPPENLSKIFDPYFTTKEGTGLGLATVYAIIKRHGGFTDVESKLEEGTTFYIYLPAGVK